MARALHSRLSLSRLRRPDNNRRKAVRQHRSRVRQHSFCEASLHPRRHVNVFWPTRAHLILILLDHAHVVTWTLEASWRRRPYPRRTGCSRSCTRPRLPRLVSRRALRDAGVLERRSVVARSAGGVPAPVVLLTAVWGLNVAFGVHSACVRFLPQDPRSNSEDHLLHTSRALRRRSGRQLRARSSPETYSTSSECCPTRESSAHVAQCFLTALPQKRRGCSYVSVNMRFLRVASAHAPCSCLEDALTFTARSVARAIQKRAA
jgi:hypothetical protein